MLTKFRVKSKDSKITIKSKLDKDESINQREVVILNLKVIREITKPIVGSIRKISYISQKMTRFFM